mmetsp:Transcript_14129/g.18841  ORF Transcript_14129/g.18841 Transcript_14129/m.18841 type:complete len:84 (+) Transcript_14129:62-313(+)
MTLHIVLDKIRHNQLQFHPMECISTYILTKKNLPFFVDHAFPDEGWLLCACLEQACTSVYSKMIIWVCKHTNYPIYSRKRNEN